MPLMIIAMLYTSKSDTTNDYSNALHIQIWYLHSQYVVDLDEINISGYMLFSTATLISLHGAQWDHNIHLHIFTFSNQAFNESFFFFATIHSLMNDINLIDSFRAHFPMQYASNTGVVIESEPQLSRTCKPSFLFLHWLYVFKLAVSRFRFTLQQNR